MTSTAPPTIVFLSVQRSASTFVAGQLARAICRELPMENLRIGWHLVRGKPMAEMALPPTGVVATRVYPEHYDQLIEEPPPAAGRFAGKRLILIRRDPRDTAVSLYYSKAFSHPVKPGIEERFLAERQRLQTLTPTDGVWELTAQESIDDFRATALFLVQFPSTCLAPYELLVTDFEAWMSVLARHLGWSDDLLARISRGLDRTVEPPRQADPLQHKRRVTPGNWSEVFDDRLRDLYQRQLGEELAAAGYHW